MKISQQFGILLEAIWLHKTSTIKFNELPLFRALNDSMEHLSNKFKIEEYHGSRHQVYFNSNRPWVKNKLARCELADLMIITYKTKPRTDIRLTFLQAKREKKKIHCLCPQHPQYSTSLNFKANCNQWDLLSKRPLIKGVHSFNPPTNLLQDAMLSSVGSFCVFHKAI